MEWFKIIVVLGANMSLMSYFAIQAYDDRKKMMQLMKEIKTDMKDFQSRKEK